MESNESTAGFMASVTCGLTAQDSHQLGEPYTRFEYGTTFIFTYCMCGFRQETWSRSGDGVNRSGS